MTRCGPISEHAGRSTIDKLKVIFCPAALSLSQGSHKSTRCGVAEISLNELIFADGKTDRVSPFTGSGIQFPAQRIWVSRLRSSRCRPALCASPRVGQSPRYTPLRFPRDWPCLDDDSLRGLIGSIRRECLDHLVAFDEAHLRRVLKDYPSYYNQVRTHLSLDKNPPDFRRPQKFGSIASISILHGLHHQYVRV